jgi:NAD(P)-dependent dehydrogenase (short-subunit alcohol dehydrogenase family)
MHSVQLLMKAYFYGKMDGFGNPLAKRPPRGGHRHRRARSEDALALARASAEVIIAGRSAEKGAAALAHIRDQVPGANIGFEQIDLADLRSVENFATRLRGQRDRLDLLINNAGVMVPPTRQETADGFEMQFGTNYLGHFALTAHLLPLLRKGQAPRIISLSSVAARQGRIDLDDLQSQNYVPMKA